jgi:hypothetical protein
VASISVKPDCGIPPTSIGVGFGLSLTDKSVTSWASSLPLEKEKNKTVRKIRSGDFFLIL